MRTESRPSLRCAGGIHLGIFILAAAAGLTLAVPAAAQSSPAGPRGQEPRPAASGPRREGKWLLEVHGGRFGELIPNSLRGGGSGAEPLPSATPFTTLNGQPTRAVPAWSFGDGAALFDEVRRSFAANQGLNLPGITPLDGVLASRGTTRTPGPAFGIRFSRDLTSWLAAEIGVDRGATRSALAAETLEGLDATRASYTSALQALLATMPQTGGRVSMTAQGSPEASSTQTVVTGSAVLALVRTSRLRINAILGGGIMMNDATSFEATLRGGYQFNVFSVFPINESETVTLRFSEKRQVPVGVIGLGFTARLVGQTGLRVDARVLASEVTARTTIDASPGRVTSGQPVTLPSISSPSIQFSSSPGTHTSLSGAPLSGVATYSGSGYDLRPQVTVGYYVRF